MTTIKVPKQRQQKFRHLLLPLFCLFLVQFFACQEPVDWAFQASENETLVLDGILTNEFKIQEIQLSLSYNDFNASPSALTGATVVVTDGEFTVPFIESEEVPGIYRSVIMFSARIEKTYSIDIQYNTKHYQATNKMVAVRPMNTLTFAPVGETDSLRIGNLGTAYTLNEEAMYEVDIDWSHLSGSDSSHIKVFFYHLSTIDVNELIPPPQESIAFPKGSIVVEKKYSLNPEFAAYFRALLLETTWQGGFFDEYSSSLPTNVSNGGLGFFGVSAILIDTLVAE